MGYWNGATYLTGMTQDAFEIAKLSKIFSESNVTSLLEVGSRFGGSLWYLAKHMPHGSKIVSIDSGLGEGGGRPGQLASLRECITQLCYNGYHARLIEGWSSNSNVIARAEQLGPYDAVFIDADHRYEGVKADWLAYGPMATKLVAFHDVCWERKPHFPPSTKEVEVPKLWAELTADGRGIIICNSEANMGIGVLMK